MNVPRALETELQKLTDPISASFLQKFFKTGPGQYAEGDRFRGIRVPVLRQLSRKYDDLETAKILLDSEWHEDRLLALLILVRRYDLHEEERDGIYKFYVKKMEQVNNWDLVDLSAPQIVGRHLWDRSHKPLYEWANSKRLWERRIAIVSTYYFIKQGELEDTFRLAGVLMKDREDLIHKATGWMLREAGKKDAAALQAWLRLNYQNMPRTMLRYAIEKFDSKERRRYLDGSV